MSERVLRISCAGETLLGILHVADDASSAPAPRRAVLMLVGGPQYRVGSHRQFVLAARHLAGRGYSVLRLDFRGMGDATGTAPGFEHVRDDVRAGIDVLFQELPSLRSVCLVGLCDAASAALLHGADDPRVDSLVIANPWVRTETGHAAAIVKHYYAKRLFKIDFWLKLCKGGMNPFAALADLFRFMRASRESGHTSLKFIDRMLAAFERFHCPVLLLSSGRDLTAREFDDICRTDPRWAAAVSRENVRRVDIPAADHTFSDRKELNTANTAISFFLGEHVAHRSVHDW